MKMLIQTAAIALAGGLALAACATPPAAPAIPAPVIAAPVIPWNAAALADVVAYAQAQKSTGFVIIQNRTVIAEHNWPLPDDAETFRANFTHGTASDGALLEDVASQQKSFIAILTGVAIDKGLLDISKPVSAYAGAGWSKASPDQEAAITVRNLLEMNSGLTEKLAFESTAGTRFFYNTPAYAILKPVLEAAGKQSLDDLTRLWLTQPAGMTDTGWRKRPGVFADAGNPTGLVTTARDVARLGQIALDGGLAASGYRVISKAQLDAIVQPTTTNPAYGRLWWLNSSASTLGVGPNPVPSQGRLIPSAPADLLAAQGAQDRKLYVSPGLNLIVARLGQQTPDKDFNAQLWLRIMKAAPVPK